MCCGTGDSGLPASLYKVAQAWKDRKEAGAAALSLRVTLMMAVFAETLSRCQDVHNSASDTQQAKDQGDLDSPGPLAISAVGRGEPAAYPQRGPSGFEADGSPVKRLLELLPLPGVLHRFHSLRPLAPAPEAPVIAFILDVGLQAYGMFLRLSQCSVTQLAAFNMRPDRLGRSALAKTSSPSSADAEDTLPRQGWQSLLIACFPVCLVVE